MFFLSFEDMIQLYFLHNPNNYQIPFNFLQFTNVILRNYTIYCFINIYFRKKDLSNNSCLLHNKCHIKQISIQTKKEREQPYCVMSVPYQNYFICLFIAGSLKLLTKLFGYLKYRTPKTICYPYFYFLLTSQHIILIIT